MTVQVELCTLLIPVEAVYDWPSDTGAAVLSSTEPTLRGCLIPVANVV